MPEFLTHRVGGVGGVGGAALHKAIALCTHSQFLPTFPTLGAT
ncbi:hypothetical protein [Nostoc sp. NMS7]|nr:hypothetical protein [Nostoc sp. NMS7]